MTKKKTAKKITKVKEFEKPEAGSTRFFFTANPKLADWIYNCSESLGLYPYEFIRAKLTKIMKD